MSRKEKQAVTLYGWQQDVVREIGLHEERRDGEASQGLADYSLNKMLGMTVAFPRGAGHTFLANYIASEYPTLLIYGKMDHYKRVTERFPLHPGTETISLYEIYYAMYKSEARPQADLLDIRKKFESKKLVVVDNGLSVSEEIKNFVYDSARGLVIVLGH